MRLCGRHHITYSNDLASAVYDAGGRELMRFIYDFDPQAGIAYTRVVYPDGTEQQFKGMADPVDIVVAMMSGLEIAKNHIMEV